MRYLTNNADFLCDRILLAMIEEEWNQVIAELGQVMSQITQW